MRLSARRATRSALLFCVLVTVAGWPHRTLRADVSELLGTLLNPLLEQLEFGQGGRVHVRHRDVIEVRRPGESVTSDADLVLGAAGHAQELPVGINLRHDFYLPLVIFVAAVLSAPVSRTRRVLAMLLGLPVVFYGCLSILYATSCWLFAHQAPLVYPLSSADLELLDNVVSVLVMPPTLRFFMPLLVAAGALALLGRRVSPDAVVAQPPHHTVLS